MVLGIKQTKSKTQAMINVAEANNLWDLTITKHKGIDRALIWLTYAKDPDLRVIIQQAINKSKKQVKSLENELNKFSILGPKQSRVKMNVSANSELLLDQDIGGYLLLAIQEEIELLFRAFRTSTTNDAIRALFVKFLTEAISDLDNTVKYLKLKGWVESSPLYPNIPNETTEQINAAETFHLWDHLTFRYDNIYQTQFWYELAKDSDLKLLLQKGLQDNLKKQAKKLEDELVKFGIPIPKRPPDAIPTPPRQSITDDYIFRSLFSGIIGAAWLHALALKQCTTNDRIRQIFKDLLVQEINILNKMILYGKTKGFFEVVPQFSPTL
ncbi:DUF3231 family protein [Metallumcola ferriviriculae]|uniref:DUF3231 family protein n=1 Tax=Metallumcola ferriviriculae TaxID=3039180 RepID=A0AAU0URS6_9FIRM|nr:DUF3231 family protein [Desulfitibacteraceae bacterium MK1]